MTSIDFYFNAPDRFQVACRLAGKALAQKKRMLIYAPDADVARKIDQMLWTWPAISFVPHCRPGDGLAADTPVLIASDPEDAPDCDVLMNLSPACPEFFARYARMLEIVSRDEDDRKAGRARYAWYRERGYAIRNHDLAATASE
jgi:DNA polymerase III subunit chi